eukprot:GHRQ01015918.1.p1 GENE.GHRQ01015918.1~~GHRQ01015918.1.p1  ORF type:complete len:256 (+),score=75.43 GHRQ01015918.1:280-1047(+)
MAQASAPRLCAALLPALLLLLLGAAEAAPTIRTDNSPVCNQIFPQCQAKCKQGLDFMFVCSAGNGPNGGPYILCQCVAPALPVGPKAQAASLVLANWPGSKACNDKTWLNDCTSRMSVQVDGSSVLFTPAVTNFANEACDPAPGVVIGPKGAQAAVSFPQYPIGLTSTGPDGTLTIDFSATAADDPNNMDWSQCIVTYKIIQGTFLNPQLGPAAQQGAAALQQARQQQAASAASSSRPLLLLLLVAAVLASFMWL